jgi:hypothetical protein
MSTILKDFSDGDNKWDKKRLLRVIKKSEAAGHLVIDRTNGRRNVYDITWFDELCNKNIIVTSGKMTPVPVPISPPVPVPISPPVPVPISPPELIVINYKKITNNQTASLNYLRNINNETVKSLCRKFNVTEKCVLARADDVIDYCEKTGRKYKNYLAALRSFIKSHLAKYPDDIIRPALNKQVELSVENRTPEDQERLNKKLADIKASLSKKMAML